MGSSFTIVNNTPTVVYVASDISWATIGLVVAAVGIALIAIVCVISLGAGVIIVSGTSTAIGLLLEPILVMAGNDIMAMAAIAWLGSGIILGGGGVTITALGAGIGAIGEGVTASQATDLQDSAQAMLQGYTKLMPGEAYRFEGPLSNRRDCSVIYDDGSYVQRSCVTAALANQNHEYRVLDEFFTTNTFMGCWLDAASDYPVVHTGADDVERVFRNRIMETRQDGKMKKDDCMYKCRGYEFFGLQAPNNWGDAECWCSNDMNLVDLAEMGKRVVETSECGGELDGAGWKMAVYKITPSKNYLNMYNWKKQEQIMAKNQRRRLAIADGASEAELERLLGEDNLAGIELIHDFHAYAAQGYESALTSEELAMDHRRLPAEKQSKLFIETIEPASRKRMTRLGMTKYSSHNHDVTAAHLASWVKMSGLTSYPSKKTCSSPKMDKCQHCVECLSCLDDASGAICKKQKCKQCDACAELPLCKAVEIGCAPESRVESSLETCDFPEGECSALTGIMKCVSESVW